MISSMVGSIILMEQRNDRMKFKGSSKFTFIFSNSGDGNMNEMKR